MVGFICDDFLIPLSPDPPPHASGPAEKSNDFFVGASGGSEISSGRWRCFVCPLCCCDSSQGNARATKTFSNLVCRPSSRVRLRVFRHRVAARGDNTSLLSWRRCSRHAPPLAIFWGCVCIIFCAKIACRAVVCPHVGSFWAEGNADAPKTMFPCGFDGFCALSKHSCLAFSVEAIKNQNRRRSVFVQFLPKF